MRSVIEETPREVLERSRKSRNGHIPHSSSTDTVVSRRMDQIEKKRLEWLVPDLIPSRSITLWAGRGGVGKGMAACKLAAAVTTDGMLLPNLRCQTGDVLMMLAEDSLEYTVSWRLEAAGADMSRIYTAESLKRVDENGKETEVALTLEHMPAIEKLIDERRPAAVFIDPMGSFVGGACDVNTDNQVREVLNPLTRIAEKYGCAIILVAHHRKSGGASADDLVLGSRAFTALSRAVFHFFDEDGRKLMLPGKSNLGANTVGLGFRVERAEGAGVAVFEADTVDLRADDWLEEQSKPGPEPEAEREAIEWLRDVLGDGSMPTKTELQEWRKRDGVPFSFRTVERAMKKAKVKSERDTLTKKWVYRLLRDGNNRPIVGGDNE